MAKLYMKKIFVIVLVLGYLVPVYGAGRSHKEETVKIDIGEVEAAVIANKTLIDVSNPQKYSVKNLFDGNKSTAWVTEYDNEDVYPDGMLKIIFQEPVYVKSATIRNGYQKTEVLYYANQRIKDLNIEKVIMGCHSYPLDNMVHLEDKMEEQIISLTEGWTQSINLFKTKELIFNIVDIYSGEKYEDLCISEITIDFSNDIEYSPSLTWEQLRELIDTNRTNRNSGWDWNGLNELSYRLFNDLLYYVITGNEEAYLYFDSYMPEGTGDSEAMENIHRPAVNKSLN